MTVSEWMRNICIAAKVAGFDSWFHPKLLPQIRRRWEVRVEAALTSIRQENRHE